MERDDLQWAFSWARYMLVFLQQLMMLPNKTVHQADFKYTNVTDSFTELEVTFSGDESSHMEACTVCREFQGD